MQISPQFFNQSEQALRHHSNKYETISSSSKWNQILCENQ